MARTIVHVLHGPDGPLSRHAGQEEAEAAYDAALKLNPEFDTFLYIAEEWENGTQEPR